MKHLCLPHHPKGDQPLADSHTHAKHVVRFWIAMLMSAATFNVGAQCAAPDIVISSNATWIDQDVMLEPNRKIIITDGATLTIIRCTIRRVYDCPGYWDGIYLVTNEEGDKAGLYVEESIIEFSQFGIQAQNGWKHIELKDVTMRDNGQMINVRDNWPLAPIVVGGGGGDINGTESDKPNSKSPISEQIVLDFDGDPGGGSEGCSEFPPAPKVIISHDSKMYVTEMGDAEIDPIKQIRQVSVLGGELVVANSEFVNGQSDWRCAAISASRGKCQIYGSKINGFWTGIYKGSDANAHCTSEGLILTGSQIINLQKWGLLNTWSIYNVTANMYIKGNIIEGNIRSEGFSYAYIQNNNIIQGDNITTTVWIDSPEKSMSIKDNKFYNSPTEYYGSNVRTDVTCNTWEFVEYEPPIAVIGGGLNQFPMSWGTINKASGNVWVGQVRPEMHDVSVNFGTLTYYYRDEEPEEVFDWFSIIDEPVQNPNEGCTYIYPEAFGDFDTTEYVLFSEELESEYNTIDSLLDAIGSTTEITILEEIDELQRQLSAVVGQGWLFMDTTNRDFWTEKLNVKVKELSDLNFFWYAQNLDTIKTILTSNSDADAQVLYEATVIALTYIDSSDIYSFSSAEVASLDSMARLSYGNYTNILRNFLYMVYDSLITWDQESVLDSIRDSESISEAPKSHDVIAVQAFSVYPNPFTDNVEVTKTGVETEDTLYWMEILTLDGKTVDSGSFVGSSVILALSNLEPGFYIVKIRNNDTGETDVHKLYKSGK